jgi:hypothetical protein
MSMLQVSGSPGSIARMVRTIGASEPAERIWRTMRVRRAVSALAVTSTLPEGPEPIMVMMAGRPSASSVPETQWMSGVYTVGEENASPWSAASASWGRGRGGSTRARSAGVMGPW